MSQQQNDSVPTPEEIKEFVETCSEASTHLANAWNASNGQHRELIRRLFWELICGLPADLRAEIQEALDAKTRMEGA